MKRSINNISKIHNNIEYFKNIRVIKCDQNLLKIKPNVME